MQTNIPFFLVTAFGLALGCGAQGANAPAGELDPAEAEPFQLEDAHFHGSDEPVAVARRSIAGAVRMIDGFVEAKEAGDLDAFQLEAGRIYADEAEIFQSQEFMTPDNLGPAAFVHMVDFLYTQLGQGQDALHPLQVCNVYAYYPEGGAPDTIEWVITTHTAVPSFGTLIATAKMQAKRQADGWRLTYHDYFDAPAPGEDCNGAQVAKIHDAWLCQVDPDAAACQ